MRGSVEDGLRRRRGLDGGGDVSNVVREEASRGRAVLAVPPPYRVPSVAPGRRVWRARRRRMVMLEITQG